MSDAPRPAQEEGETKSDPRAPQDLPKNLQERPKTPQERPKSSQEGPKSPPTGTLKPLAHAGGAGGTGRQPFRSAAPGAARDRVL